MEHDAMGKTLDLENLNLLWWKYTMHTRYILAERRNGEIIKCTEYTWGNPLLSRKIDKVTCVEMSTRLYKCS